MNQPNIVFIMTDDHASHSMSCYGSKINVTPNMDRIANEGMRFDNCFCTNSICAPSRAVILTGKHSHLNGVITLNDEFDGRQQTFPKLLQKAGYQTGIIGKWHLGEGGYADPTGFDYYCVLHGQGEYFDPKMREQGEDKIFKGYATDIITDMSLNFIKDRDKSKPFMLMCHHKAPHRPWTVSAKYADLYKDEEILQPETFDDDYATRCDAAREAEMRIDNDFMYRDLKLVPPPTKRPMDKIPPPDSLEGYTLTPEETGVPVSFSSYAELKNFKYQRYIKDYLRCVASVDDGIGQLLDCLNEEGIAEDTIVVYTSDQGFFLGDHGWYDKRFMYEESLRMPFVIKYPRAIKAGRVSDKMILNLDFAETFLDFAGVPIPDDMQGKSFRRILEDENAPAIQTAMYYRYWMHLAHHNIWSHYGIRTLDYKLIYYYAQALGKSGTIDEYREAAWELFDLKKDPHELNNVYDNPEYADLIVKLKDEMYKLKAEAEDEE
ncbi:sulfatase [Candidatus Epulonipiscium viviparus]|uniref:sulfatase family protein n=1 Tax=Candidatus Epulonipiscium viviparus TaxID=420336 RepID=UPI000497B1DF|nr:sulfatase [Candidatus Epulopiscium viviparus]